MKSFNRIKKLNQVVVDLIDEKTLDDVVVADIATDHGYLAELLSRNEKIKKVIATDISQACLDKVIDLKSRCKLDKIETILGDGLEPIDKVDVAVMAGIGGYEIIKILNNQNKLNDCENKCNLFVFQPSKNVAELRRYLIKIKVGLIRDFIVMSGKKFYPIIVASFVDGDVLEDTLFNVYFGRDNVVENKDFLMYLCYVIEEYKFLENLTNDDILKSDELITKFNIYNLAKELYNNRKEREDVW